MAEFDDLIPVVEGDNPFADLHPTDQAPPPISLSPYEKLRMQGVGAGLSATAGPVGTPEEAAQIFASLAEPAIPIPRINAKSTLGQIAAAPYNVAAGLAENIESPLGAATLPLFGSPVGRAAFAALGTVQGLRQLATAKTPGEATEGALLAGISPLLARTTLKERIPNAPQERYVQENIPSQRPGDGEVGPPRETSGGGGLQPETGVDQETPLSLRPDTVTAIQSARAKYGADTVQRGLQVYMESFGGEPKSEAVKGVHLANFVKGLATGDAKSLDAIQKATDQELLAKSQRGEDLTAGEQERLAKLQAQPTPAPTGEGQPQAVTRSPKNFVDMSDDQLVELWHRYRNDYSRKPTPALDKQIELVGSELAHRSGLPEGTELGTRGFRPVKEETPSTTVEGKAPQPAPSEVTATTPVSAGAEPAKPEPTVTSPVTQPGQLGGGAAEAGEIPETGMGGEKYGVAERIRLEREKAGQVGEVVPGQGINTPESIGRGRALLQADPGSAERLMTAFESTKSLSSDAMAVARAHGENLAAKARTIEERFGTDSPEYRAARDELTAWDKRSKAMQTEWHKTGMAQQGETDLDTGSYTGLERAFNGRTGKDFTPQQGKRAKKVAKGVADADQAVTEGRTALSTVLDHEFPKQKPLPPAEQAALDAAWKAVRENDARIAKLDSTLRVAEQARQTALDKLAQAREKAALDAASKTVRGNARRIAKEENDARVAEAKRKTEVAEIQVKAAQGALDAMAKTTREAAARLAKLENERRVSPEKTVWEKIKAYMDQGETNVHTMRGKVATEMGISRDKVTELMARTARMKRLADNLILKQQTLRRAHDAAKRWLMGLEEPLLEKIPRWLATGMFKVRVGLHGTVAPGTHAPMLLFKPGEYENLIRNSAKMYRMVGVPTPAGQRTARVLFENQMADLVRDRSAKDHPGDENYWGVARRNGLINDPNQYEDFTSPDTAKFFGDLTGMGNRGYSMLKLLRQDMFNDQWKALPNFMRTDAMAKGIADQINHITGVTQKPPFQGSHYVLFAPRLLLSRLAWLGHDPYRALTTMVNWKDASIEDKAFATREIKGKLTVFATMMSALAANQALLSMSGSKQKVNLTDPNQSDFLHFKALGMDASFGSPMINMAKLPARLVAIGMGPKGKLGKIVSPDDQVWTEAGRFISGQLSPIAQLALQTAVTREDPTGKQLPHSVRPMPKRLTERGIKPYTWPEYVTQQLSPIPFQEFEKEIWGKQFGATDKEIKAWTTLLFMLGTGGRMREDLPKQATKTTLP